MIYSLKIHWHLFLTVEKHGGCQATFVHCVLEYLYGSFANTMQSK